MSIGQLGLQSFLSKFGTDIIGIYEQNDAGAPTQQIVTDANIMRASVNTQSRIFSHPLANGSVRSDHVIDLPIEIELALIVTNKKRIFQEFDISITEPSQAVLRNIYNTLLEFYNARRLIAVQTRASLYTNLIIQAMPHQETVDVYNGLLLVVKLQETRFAIPIVGVFSPSDPVQTDTQERGAIQPQPPSAPQQSAAASLLDSLTGSLSGFYNAE